MAQVKEAPEPRDIRKVIRLTASEERQLQAKLKDAGSPEATAYMRHMILGDPLAKLPRGFSMDGIRFAKIMGALGQAIPELVEIRKLIALGDLPFASKVEAACAHTQLAADQLLEFLEKIR